MAPGPSFDPEGIEQALRCLPGFELRGLFRRSSNYTFLAELRGSIGLEETEMQPLVSMPGMGPAVGLGVTGGEV